MNGKTFLLVLMAASLLSGCLRKEILDDINIESAVGFDYVSPTKIKGTVLIPIYKKEETANKTLTAVSVSTKDILEELQHKTPEPLVNGSIEVALYGKQLAEHGLFPFVDNFHRDSSIGTGLYLAVVDGTAEQLLKGHYGRQGNGIYLSNLLKHNIEQRDVPKTNLHLFLKMYYADGQDPFWPYLRQVGQDVQVEGIALFRGDRVVDYIERNNMFFFKILTDSYTEGTHTVRLQKGNYASVKNISTKRTISFSGPKTRPHLHIHLSLEGVIREHKQGPFTPSTQQAVQQQFEKEIKINASNLLRRFQEQNIDPIGLGEWAKSQYRHFSYRDFYRRYRHLPFRITADVRIRDTGIIE
ncbi:hypothetical protein LR69_01158 [Geobacillus sp. BCO2]|nr:hypothetical protein LR69_01158 [Geobacillus sp. BCO2]